MPSEKCFHMPRFCPFFFFFFLGMNQFGQIGGMQSMGQRSTPPLAPLNQVGITVAFSVITLGSYEYHLLTHVL